MAKSKIIGVRIPDHLLREIENFGLMNFPKNDSFDMTKSLLFLIQRGLQTEGIESPKSPAPSVIDESINVNNSLNIDELKEALEGDLKPSIESIARELLENYLKANKALNSAFDEQSIEKLELQIDELKEAQNAINDKIYQRLENLESQSSQGFKALEVDSPTELTLVIEVNDSLLNTLTPDQQSVLMAIIEGKSENEIKDLIPVSGNKLYLQGLAKSLGFKNVTTLGINKLIPLMKNCLIIANK